MLAVNEKEINLKAPVTIPGIDVTTLYCVIACAANLCLLSRVPARWLVVVWSSQLCCERP
jgi:hypothetical protein